MLDVDEWQARFGAKNSTHTEREERPDRLTFRSVAIVAGHKPLQRGSAGQRHYQDVG